MNDKRIVKIKQHYNVFLNGSKFKVISCEIDEENGMLSIKTKVFGQRFPQDGSVKMVIPSQGVSRELSVSFCHMDSTPVIEHWVYTIIQE